MSDQYLAQKLHEIQSIFVDRMAAMSDQLEASERRLTALEDELEGLKRFVARTLPPKAPVSHD